MTSHQNDCSHSLRDTIAAVLGGSGTSRASNSSANLGITANIIITITPRETNISKMG